MKIRTDQLRSLIERQVRSLIEGNILTKDVDTGRRTMIEISRSAGGVRIQFGSAFSITLTSVHALDFANAITMAASGE